MKPDNETN